MTAGVATGLLSFSLVAVIPAQALAEPSPLGDTRNALAQRQLAHLGYDVPMHAVTGSYVGKPATREITAFQKRYGVKQTGRVDSPTRKALDKYAGSATVPKRCLTGEFTICVDKHARVTRAISGDGKVLRVMDSRFGGPGMETRNGKFEVYRHGRNHVSTDYGSKMPFSLFFSGGQAVHYSYEFASDPNSSSHGCVGLRDWDDAEWLYERAEKPGTPVIVYDKKPA